MWSQPQLRRKTQLFVDVMVFAAAFALSYLLHFEFPILRAEVKTLFFQFAYVVLLQFVVLRAVGGHKFVWRYIGMSEIRAFIDAALISLLSLLILKFALSTRLAIFTLPLALIFTDVCFAFGGALLLRVATRAAYERSERNGARSTTTRRPILLIGAGQAGVIVVRELRARGESDLEIKGFIDDDPRKQGARIQGVDVLGTTKDIAWLAPQHKIDHVIITIARSSGEEIRRIVKTCEAVPVHVRIMPALSEIIEGNVQVSRFRDVQIEDLLGRDTVTLDASEVGKYVTGKRIMVTGAGGSIGGELARQIERYHPSKLLLVERSEGALFNIQHEICGPNGNASTIVPLLADINDSRRMRTLFEDFKPDVVLHAAAHKHVPMLEGSPAEAVKNNVLATNLIGELAGEHGVEVFVLISTDKAVNPVSVMGASKRVAELVVQDLNRRYEQTRFLAVRFGNVIGSAGSVIPIFQEQIRRLGPVTVTDKRMERYFMTLTEAAQLVLQAGSLGLGGEIFILEMGAPVRIYDLARSMIASQGLKAGEDVEIRIIGIRPGEKLFEELKPNGEKYDETRHPKILVGKIPAYPTERVAEVLRQMEDLADKGDQAASRIRRLLNQLLPEANLEIKSEEGAERLEICSHLPQINEPTAGQNETMTGEIVEIEPVSIRTWVE